MTAGIEFLKWTLKGMPFFKDQSFDFSKPGISLVLGKNLDSSNDNPNGAGKSFFFSELAELLISKPVIGERQDIIRKGSRELVFRKGKHLYTVTRSFHPGEKLRIERDGVDLEYRELSAAHEALSKLIPYSPQEVLSLFYLDSRVPHPLTRGSSAARREFFLRFFRMSAAPQMRKVVKAEVDRLRGTTGALTEVTAGVKLLRQQVADKDVPALEASLEEMQGQLTQLSVNAKEYQRIAKVVADFQAYSDELEALAELGVSTEGEAEALVAKTERRITRLSESRAAWNSYEAGLAARKESLEKVEWIKRLLPEKLTRDPVASVELTQARLDLKRESLRVLKTRKEALETNLDEEALAEEGRIEKRIQRLRESIASLKKESDTCPTCGGPWDNKHAKQEEASARSKIKELTTEGENLARMRKQATCELKTLTPEYEELVLQVNTQKERLGLLQDLVGHLSVSTVEKPSGSKDEVEMNLAAARKTRDALEGSTRALRVKATYDELTKKERRLATLEDPTEAYVSLSEKASDLKVEIGLAKAKKQELAEARARRDKLKEELQDLPALELLYEAFSKKGIEALMIQTITDRLSMLVNKYSKFIFPEDYTFSFELETQFSFLVTRRYGKKVEVSDVRKLSGAESLLFNLVLYVALLSFVPKQNRPSVLILDEPTSNMGQELKESFLRFLPILQKVTPHIIIITPDTYAGLSTGMEVFTVVKQKGVSKFVEGRV